MAAALEHMNGRHSSTPSPEPDCEMENGSNLYDPDDGDDAHMISVHTKVSLRNIIHEHQLHSFINNVICLLTKGVMNISCAVL